MGLKDPDAVPLQIQYNTREGVTYRAKGNNMLFVFNANLPGCRIPLFISLFRKP